MLKIGIIDHSGLTTSCLKYAGIVILIMLSAGAIQQIADDSKTVTYNDSMIASDYLELTDTDGKNLLDVWSYTYFQNHRYVIRIVGECHIPSNGSARVSIDTPACMIPDQKMSVFDRSFDSVEVNRLSSNTGYSIGLEMVQKDTCQLSCPFVVEYACSDRIMNALHSDILIKMTHVSGDNGEQTTTKIISIPGKSDT